MLYSVFYCDMLSIQATGAMAGEGGIVMTHQELSAARNYLERAYLILKMSDCVQCEDILSEINQLDLTIKELGN